MKVYTQNDIKGYEGLYSINNKGVIKSLKRDVYRIHPAHGTKYKCSWKSRTMRHRTSSNGYDNITLCKEGKPKVFLVHRLVAIAFIPNPDNKKTVNHINGIKSDNSVANLEWATYSENIKHAYRTGLIKSYLIGKFGGLHNTAKKVYKYSMNGIFIGLYTSLTEASIDNNSDVGAITKACQGIQAYAHGYKWSYENPELLTP